MTNAVVSQMMTNFFKRLVLRRNSFFATESSCGSVLCVIGLRLFSILTLMMTLSLTTGSDAVAQTSSKKKILSSRTRSRAQKKIRKFEFKENQIAQPVQNKTVIYNPKTGTIKKLTNSLDEKQSTVVFEEKADGKEKSSARESAQDLTDPSEHDSSSNQAGQNVSKVAKLKDKKNNKRKEAEDTITDVNLRRALKGVDDLSTPWGMRLNARTTTDLADPASQKIFTNALGFNYEYTFKNALTLYAGTGVRYVSVDNNTRAVSGDKPELDDIYVGAAGPIFDRTLIPFPLSGNLTFTLPTSEDARYEGYKGVVSTSINTFFSFWRFTLIPTVYVNYVMNKFNQSPQTMVTNSDWTYGSNARLNFRLGAGFTTFVGGGVNFVHYLDQVYTSGVNNVIGVGYASSSGSFIVNLALVNGSYPDQSSSNLWFVDQYRRNLSLSFSYLFN